AVVALFVFAMTMLVLSENLLGVFLFWEGVGVCSYLLVGHWHERPTAAAAAFKAFLVNRVGDFGFLFGALLLWWLHGQVDGWNDPGSLLTFTSLFDAAGRIFRAEPEWATLACGLLFLGAMGKSAQFPLHVWLPDAMEGPTPVSALIHAATMVTAGVYITARLSPLLIFAPEVQKMVLLIGAITALYAALTALTQTDLKKMLAYSTVSQLGLMFMAVGAAAADPHLLPFAVTAAVFHLFTHAFFKGLLFLSAGSVMHAMGDVIDMREFSGLRKKLPATHLLFAIGTATIAGVPMLSAFWSKDEILAVLDEAYRHDGPNQAGYRIAFFVAAGTSLLTAFYSFRAYFLTFWGDEKIPAAAEGRVHEAPNSMLMPMRVLAVAAIGVGLAFGPTHLFAEKIKQTTGLTTEMKPHDPSLEIMGVSLLVAIVGIAAAWVLRPSMAAAADKAGPNLQLFGRMFSGTGLDHAYTVLVVRPLRVLALFCNVFDRYVLDELVHVAAWIPLRFGQIFQPMQTGRVQSYGYVMLLGLTGFVLLIVTVAIP
ncbi:MAG: NADH-quinone oxidoreductase subunit L, partial [Planctomycetia bacterium]